MRSYPNVLPQLVYSRHRESFVEFASRFNEISDDCCGEFVVDFAEMASPHDTVNDGSVIGAEIDDSGDFVDQNQTVICRPD